MIQRVLFGTIFIALGALAAGWWQNRSLIEDKKSEKINAFMAEGVRFTGNDGKELCEYVDVIAKHSISFQQSGLPLLDCDKYIRNRAK
jgi:hypothetical protein